MHGSLCPIYTAGPDAVRGLVGVNWPIALNVFRLQILRRRVSESSEMQFTLLTGAMRDKTVIQSSRVWRRGLGIRPTGVDTTKFQTAIQLPSTSGADSRNSAREHCAMHPNHSL